MSHFTIKLFFGKRDSKEDSEEYLKNVKFFYNNDYIESKVSNDSDHKSFTFCVLF